MIITKPESESSAGIIKHSCGILFILFSFCYLFFLQGEIISKVQFVYSRGVTTYSFFWGAIIITLIGRIIQMIVERFVRVPLRYYALTYIPSILFLTVVCSVNKDFPEKISVGFWWIGVPLVLLIFYYLIKAAFFFESVTMSVKHTNRVSPYLWPNCIILILVMLWCGTCCAPSDINMFEQKVERLVDNNKFDEALRVGEQSLTSSIHLTNMRMYSLSQLDLLPQNLFDYPQNYGSEGLICVSDTNSRFYRFDARDICFHLGVECDTLIHSVNDVFEKAYLNYQFTFDSIQGVELSRFNNKDSVLTEIHKKERELTLLKHRIDDYLLCSLLLERNINDFKAKINEIYAFGINNADSVISVENLPKSYREALVMIYPEIGDTAMIKQYGEYLDMKTEIPDSTASSNQTRRLYGTTFWWYYYNPKITK